MYSKVIENINMIENNEDMTSKIETYHYIGEHVDGYDMNGSIVVYHYISNTLLRNRKLKEVSPWEYDMELWPGDKLWLKASSKEPIMIELNY